MGIIRLPGFTQTTQPQSGPIQINPGIRADFAWIASSPKSSVVGPAISSLPAGKLVTSAGLAINSGYAVVAATIPSLYTTTWTEIGSVLLDGTNAVYPLSARDDGQAVQFNSASNTIDLVMWGIIDVNISGTLPIGIVHYVAKRSGSSHTVWLNGKLFGTASASNTPSSSTGILPAIGAQEGSGGAAGGGPLVATTGVLTVIRTGLALADSYCQQLSANPWQLFKSPQRVMMMASFQTYIYTPTGGFILSGASPIIRGAIKTPTGGIAMAGAAPQTRGIVKTASGGIALAGTAPQARGISRTASGGITLGGAATVLRGVARTASGGILFAGAAPVSFHSAVQTLIVTPVGGMVLAGTAAVVRACTRVTSGGIALAGSAGVVLSYFGAVVGNWISVARHRRRD